MSWRIVREGDTPSLTLGNLKQRLRVEHDLDDGMLRHLINVARQYIETYTRKLLGEKTLEITLDRGVFNRMIGRENEWIPLPVGPLHTLQQISIRKQNDEWVDIPMSAAEVSPKGIRFLTRKLPIRLNAIHSMCIVGMGGVALNPLLETIWFNLVQHMYESTEVNLTVVKHTLQPLCANDPLVLI